MTRISLTRDSGQSGSRVYHTQGTYTDDDGRLLALVAVQQAEAPCAGLGVVEIEIKIMQADMSVERLAGLADAALADLVAEHGDEASESFSHLSEAGQSIWMGF